MIDPRIQYVNEPLNVYDLNSTNHTNINNLRSSGNLACLVTPSVSLFFFNIITVVWEMKVLTFGAFPSFKLFT